MDIESSIRLLLIYAHLMLCVFALHEVLVGDWKVLRRTVRAEDLMHMHRRIVWLLSGLWLTGLAVAALDTGLAPVELAQKTKTVAKLVTVGILTVNGAILRHWCLPRITRAEQLGMVEMTLVMSAGAVSTSSWLMAAFLGVATPLRSTPVDQLLALYGSVLAAAIVAAAALAAWWRRRAGQPARRRALVDV